MPGIIRVSVLEAVDLPEVLTDGIIGKGVTAKVMLGQTVFNTEPGIADEGRIDSWKSEFTFPVMNLRDKLMVTICNIEDQSVTQTAIEISSIIEKGSRDEFVELEGGGRILLRMSFVLTDEERKKIKTMRLSTLKRRDKERLKRAVIFQTVQPTYEHELRKSPVSTVTISEVDVSTTDEWKATRVTENGPLGFGSTTKPLVPLPVFDYARAVGSQSSRCFRTKSRSSAGESYNSRKPVSVHNDVMNLQGRDIFTDLANEHQEVEWRIESQRAQNMLVAEATAMANSHTEECILYEGQMEKRILSGGSSHLAYRKRTQKWDTFHKARPAFIKTEIPNLEGQPGQGSWSELRLGPGARWAPKAGLETRWTSPKKARRVFREEWNGHVTDPLKARVKILELIKAAGFSHQSYGDRSFQEHHSIADSIGAVLHKVVGGAAILLAALFIMWPLVEGSPDRGAGLTGDDR